MKTTTQIGTGEPLFELPDGKFMGAAQTRLLVNALLEGNLQARILTARLVIGAGK